MENLVGKKFEILDHGHIVLVDVMGSDQAVVDAARTSYQKGTQTPSDNRTLIRYLMRHKHTSPLETCAIKIHVKLPIFVERQWARHRTAAWNEVSARYSELPEEYFVPDAESIRAQSTTNKQGRDEPLADDVVSRFQETAGSDAADSFGEYRTRLGQGVARELARINLPLSTYTEKVWFCSLHNTLHFLGLRMDSHAQKEIRDYATCIGEQIIAPLFPLVWEAFVDYRLNDLYLSGPEVALLRKHFQSSYSSLSSDYVLQESSSGLGTREKRELITKLQQLGVL